MLSRKTLLGAGAALFAFAAFPGSTAALDANFKQVVRSESDKRAAYGAAKAILDMLTVIGIFTPDTSVNAWDFAALPDMCEVFMRTQDGHSCYASVNCQEGGNIEYYAGADWSVCYVGGRQFFNDPRIGDFSVTFTKKDGTEGEGLTDPVLSVAAVDGGREFDVSAFSQVRKDGQQCEAGIAPIDCFDGPFICEYSEGGNTQIYDDRTKRYRCGVPKLGAVFPPGEDWEEVIQRARDG